MRKERPPPRAVGGHGSRARHYSLSCAQAGLHLRVWHAETPFAATLGYVDSEHEPVPGAHAKAACAARGPWFREKPRCRAAGLYHQYPAGTESDVYSRDYFGPAPAALGPF